MSKVLKKELAVNVLLTLAGKMPGKLLIDLEGEQAKFTIDFLWRLDKISKDGFDRLKAEAKNFDENFSFLFYQQSKSCPTVEIKDFENFELNHVQDVIFNGNTAPYLSHNDAIPTRYMVVILITP